MKYLHKVFKAKKGSHVIVHFSHPTKVMLLGDSGYKQYKEHKTYNYRGGMMEGNQHEFTIPNDGLWHVVVEKGSYYNPMPVTASVEVHGK
jgi:hypothetical protein